MVLGSGRARWYGRALAALWPCSLLPCSVSTGSGCCWCWLPMHARLVRAGRSVERGERWGRGAGGAVVANRRAGGQEGGQAGRQGGRPGGAVWQRRGRGKLWAGLGAVLGVKPVRHEVARPSP